MIAEQREEERKHEIIRQQTIAEVERHTREIEERTQKAVADYREERRRVDDEIQAAIDRHDLETVRREQEKKAAIDAALKKKMEEDEAKRKAEAALKAKWEAEHAKEIACCYPNPVSGGCYPKLPVGYITAEALNAYHIPWRYDQVSCYYPYSSPIAPIVVTIIYIRHASDLFPVSPSYLC